MKAQELQFPIKYFENNLLFNRYDKCCWAVFRIEGFGYDYKSEEEKMDALAKTTRFIANSGRKSQIIGIPIAQNLKEHFDVLRANSDDKAMGHCNATEEYLGEVLEGATNDYEWYVLTQMRKPGLKLEAGDIIREPWKLANEFITAEDSLIAQSDIKNFKRNANQYYESQNRRLRLQELDTEQVQWLLKRINHRGEDNAPIRRNATSQWTPSSEDVEEKGKRFKKVQSTDIVSMFGDMVVPQKNTLEIEHQDGTKSYQTFLTVAHLPEGFAFPGSEWIAMLMDYDFGVEVCIKIETIEYKKAMKKISGNVDEIKGQMQHVAEFGAEIPDELYENREATDEIKRDLKEHKDPLCEVSFTFCIADTDKKRLDENARTIIDDYDDMEFKIERPFEDQLTLYYDCIPGTGRYMRDYIHRVTPEVIASSMFPAKKELGDDVGRYIGYMNNGKYVYLMQELAIMNNTSAGAYFSGTLGGGKSFNANLIGYLATLYGGKMLVIDPKNDRYRWAKTLPEFDGEINMTTLSSGKADMGKLDPFVIFRGMPSEASNLALSMICEMYGIRPGGETYTVLSECIERVSRSPKPSMLRLIKALTEVPKTDEYYRSAYNLARQMNADRKVGLATLMYGRGDEAGLSYDKKINILAIENLVLPSPETPKEEYNLEERVSMALMIPITMFARKFEDSDKTTFKIIIFDESWALNRSTVGKSLMEGIARKGRSQNTAPIFIGHSVTDIPNEGVEQAMTYRFCFRANTDSEAERVCEWLGIEASDENKEDVRNLRNGECFFRDLFGNVDKLRLDVGPAEHLLNAFETNPSKVQQWDAEMEAGTYEYPDYLGV